MKKAVAFILAAIVMSGCVFCGNAADENKITVPVTDAVFAAEKLSLEKKFLALGTEGVSDFIFSSDYTVKSGEEMSLAFAAPRHEFEKIYGCDFDGGETLKAVSGNGEIKNTENRIVLKGANWLKTESIADNIRDIDLSFDFKVYHEWTNFLTYIRGGQLTLNIRGSAAAGDEKMHIVLKNTETGDVVFYSEPVASGRVQIYAADNSVNVFLDGTSVINYVYPDICTPKSGDIFFTSTECEISLDNIKLYGGNGVKSVYNCDFDSGETLKAASGTGEIKNTENRLVLKGTNWLQTESIAADAGDFELSFNVWANHDWTNAFVFMRDSELTLNIRGRLAAENGGGAYFILTNRITGETVSYDRDISGKGIKISAVGKEIKVYADGENVINYSYPESCEPKSGPIFFTVTECAATLDNLKLLVKKGADINPFNSGIFVNIGETVTLTEIGVGGKTVLASGGELKNGKNYSFRIIRNGTAVSVYANRGLILTADIGYAPSAGICRSDYGAVGLCSSVSGAKTENVTLYNSSKLEIRGSYAEMLPIADNVPRNFAVAAQSVADGDASVTADRSSNTFAISSPSSINAWVKTTELLEENMENLYVRFDLCNSRSDWSYDVFYFGDYEFHFDCGMSPDTPWVSDKDGNRQECGNKYKSYGMSYYTLEFMKKGDNIRVYYYPTGGEHTLFFEGECIAKKTNLIIKKQQGTLTFKNFAAYDGYPSRIEVKQGEKTDSDICFLSDGYGVLPFKTTFAEFKRNMLNGDKITAYRNGRKLLDGDYVYTGTKMDYEGYSDCWSIGTSADLDGNGKVDIADIYHAKNIMRADSYALTDTRAKAADTDFDGRVTDADIDLIRKSILGESVGICTKTGADDCTENSETAIEPNGTILISISLRDYTANYNKKIAALQAELCWDNEKAIYVDNSLQDMTDADGFCVYSGETSGGLKILYEPNSVQSAIDKGISGLFSFELKVSENTSGEHLKVRLADLTAVFDDGTVLPLVSTASREFDVF